MKKQHNEGFSLVELLVSIVILAAIVLPTCTSLVLAHQLNAKTDRMMQAQLSVSSAVETLMAEGVTDAFLGQITDEDPADDLTTGTCARFPGLRFELRKDGACYSVKVTDAEGLVAVNTSIRYEGGGT